MILLWHYYWPVIAAALVIGVVCGLMRRRKRAWLVGGIVGAVALGALWHGPLGTGERLAGRIESLARAELDRFEMTGVAARIERGPLSRDLRLAGPADDFQQSELVRIMGELPGVSSARWQAGGFRLPLLAEACLAALIGFGLGLLLAYLYSLHRRASEGRVW